MSAEQGHLLQPTLTLLEHCPEERKEIMDLLAQCPATRRASCPQCGATTVQVVNVEKKSLGAALLAEWLLESTAAGVAAGSKTILCNACVACGFQWVPGSLPEAVGRLLADQFGQASRQRIMAQLTQSANEYQEAADRVRRETRRDALIMVSMVAGVALLIWSYTAYFSPQAKALRHDLERTDAWVACVVKQPQAKKPDCGPSVSRASLNAWFTHGHMDVLGNLALRARLTSLTAP